LLFAVCCLLFAVCCLLLFLREKVTNETAMVFVVDTGEEFFAKLSDCFWTVEWHLFILCATAEVARHALRNEDWFDLGVEIDWGK
jgi:hypothetical protein